MHFSAEGFIASRTAHSLDAKEQLLPERVMNTCCNTGRVTTQVVIPDIWPTGTAPEKTAVWILTGNQFETPS
ncbi:hypothetical protein AAFF_G00190260 [Aldrovandia affinis]|uniref:Uncharacterized protein n=1 Tax=Aldrovandia affinis TaxID=143900 RepID=A0AAD7RJQ4_9TELE|nr:hypothetical protein AAFF_G00190260 [Aldrovandia affinis]